MGKLLVSAALSIMAAVMSGKTVAASMPSECLQKMHLAEGSSEMVQEATENVIRAAEAVMIESNGFVRFNTETLEFEAVPFDAEVYGADHIEYLALTLNTMGSAYQSLALYVELHLQNTLEAWDCIERRWP